MKILIVDDDVRMTDTLLDILKEKNHEVEAVNDGFDAIKQIISQNYGLILMDIKMPRLNGIETLKKIKSIKPFIKVFMMTAFTNEKEDWIGEALKEGAYRVLFKPLNIEQLIQIIEKLKNEIEILLVDDDLEFLHTFKENLHEKKYKIFTSATGEDALKIVKAINIDLVFIDIKLPDLNGLDLLLAMQKINSSIKGIFVTGYKEEMQELIKEAFKNGLEACLYKPIDFQHVFSLLKKYKEIKIKINSD